MGVGLDTKHTKKEITSGSLCLKAAGIKPRLDEGSGDRTDSLRTCTTRRNETNEDSEGFGIAASSTRLLSSSLRALASFSWEES